MTKEEVHGIEVEGDESMRDDFKLTLSKMGILNRIRTRVGMLFIGAGIIILPQEVRDIMSGKIRIEEGEVSG